MSEAKIIVDLFKRLQQLQPDAVWVGFRNSTDDFYVYFSDSPPMEMGEFQYGSPTRDLLEEMAERLQDLHD
tara:strand:+ start:100 stop:312 length:213 start_codon:yes stop_codon:yes gene_type:complete